MRDMLVAERFSGAAGGLPKTAFWAFLVISGVYLALVGGTYAAVGAFLPALVGQAAVLIILVGWAMAGLRSRRWWPSAALAGWIGIALAAMALSVLLSPVPRLAANGLGGASGLFLAYLLLRRVADDPWSGPRLRALMVIVPVGVAVAYLIQIAVEWVGFWSLVGGPAVPPLRPTFAGLTFGSPNLVATSMISLAPFSAMVLAARGRPAVGAAVGATAFLVVALTGSRGGLVGAATATLVVAGFGWWRNPSHAGRFVRLWPVALVATLIPVGLVVAQRLGQGGEAVRLELWRTAVAVFVDHPLTGGGPGTWALLRLAEASPVERTFVVAHAHDLYLHTLAELGMVGTAAAGMLVVATIRLVITRVRSQESRVSLPAIGLLAGLLAVAAQSITDVVTNIPGTLLPVVALIALTESSEYSETTSPPLRIRDRAAWAITWLLAGSIVIPMMMASDLAWARAEEGRSAAASGDWAAARAAYGDAVALDPLPIYRQQEAIAEAHGGDRARALALLDDFVTIDGLPHHLIARAYLLLWFDRRGDALADAHAAYARSLGDPVALLNISRVAELVGDRQLALDAAAGAIAAAPPIAADPWWGNTDRLVGRSANLDAAVERARAIYGPGQAGLVLAFAGDLAGARAELADVDDSRGPVLMAIAEAVAGSRTRGLDDLKAHVARQPLDWYASAWLWKLLRDEDPTLAYRYGRLAFAAQADSAPGVVGMPTRIGTGLGSPQFRLPGYYPNSIYGRLGPEELLPPEALDAAP